MATTKKKPSLSDVVSSATAPAPEPTGSGALASLLAPLASADPGSAAKPTPLNLQQYLSTVAGRPITVPPPSNAPFDLSSQLQAAAAPYLSALHQVLGQGTPGLAGYIASIQGSGVPGAGGLAALVQQGLGNVQTAMSPLEHDISTALSQSGNAGYLADLLNAARYQAIYKQSSYGQPPQNDPALKALYDAVVSGGNQLSTGINLQNPTQPSPTGGVPQNAFGG